MARQETMFGTILLATDLTETSAMATEYAASYAAKFGGKIVAVHVITPDAYQFIAPEGIVQCFDAVERRSREQMAKIDQRLAGIPHACVIRHGFLWDELGNVIRQHGVDLIVAGSKPRSPAGRFLFGSVAEEILRRAPCPTLIVPSDSERPRERFKYVLLATDLSTNAHSSAALAAELAAHDDAVLTFLHVIDYRTQIADRARVLSCLRQQVSHLITVPADLAHAPRVRLEIGRPEERIAEEAQQHDADIVVMAMHSTEHVGWTTRFRTVLRDVLTRINRPVLAVPAAYERQATSDVAEAGYALQ